MPCYRCGVRQTDPERGKSPWRRGVARDRLVLVCPACQESTEWTADLDHCAKCRSAHLIRRLGQVECLDCGLVREPEASLVPVGGPDAAGTAPALADTALADTALADTALPDSALADSALADTALADEVGRALDRLLGRR